MEGKSACLYKLLAFGVIVLFIGVGIQPVIADATYTHSSDEEDIESLDATFEIISFIRGYCKSTNWFPPFVVGSVEINGEDGLTLKITALTINPLKLIYHTKSATYISASKFIGYSTPASANHDAIYGIAFGNIEWS